ncbi:MAG: hypothetical protein AAGA85_03140 [Bacteroidota bacterium]
MAPRSDKTLHLLNGDATVPGFRDASIPGGIAIWREVMVEGPTTGDIRSEAFWARRKDFLDVAYEGVGPEEPFSSQLALLDNATDIGEVVLWFEYDLFCQVNLLAALAYIQHPNVSLVCLGDQIGGQWLGLGQISAKEFEPLYRQRIRLDSASLVYAGEAWGAYTGNDIEVIKSFREPHASFPFLDRAIQAHMNRFPGWNGVNALEHDMLEIVKDGVRNKRQLIGQMLRNHPWMGFGDLQYYRILRSVELLIGSDLTLTEKGEEVLDHRAQFPQPKEYLGGIYRPDYFKATYGN